MDSFATIVLVRNRVKLLVKLLIITMLIDGAYGWATPVKWPRNDAIG